MPCKLISKQSAANCSTLRERARDRDYFYLGDPSSILYRLASIFSLLYSLFTLLSSIFYLLSSIFFLQSSILLSERFLVECASIDILDHPLCRSLSAPMHQTFQCLLEAPTLASIVMQPNNYFPQLYGRSLEENSSVRVDNPTVELRIHSIELRMQRLS